MAPRCSPRDRPAGPAFRRCSALTVANWHSFPPGTSTQSTSSSASSRPARSDTRSRRPRSIRISRVSSSSTRPVRGHPTGDRSPSRASAAARRSSRSSTSRAGTSRVTSHLPSWARSIIRRGRPTAAFWRSRPYVADCRICSCTISMRACCGGSPTIRTPICNRRGRRTAPESRLSPTASQPIWTYSNMATTS